MAESVVRRPILKRIVKWTAAFVLLLVLYLCSAPINQNLTAQHIPALAPAVYAAYFPAECYFQHSELPGSDAYRTYVDWLFLRSPVKRFFK